MICVWIRLIPGRYPTDSEGETSGFGVNCFQVIFDDELKYSANTFSVPFCSGAEEP